MNTKECPICLENLADKFIIGTPCSHIFCVKCFMFLPNKLCPICRNNLNKKTHKKEYVQIKNAFKDDFKFNDYDFPPLG